MVKNKIFCPSVKKQLFCVGDVLKMVKQKAWATTAVAPKLVESMTTKEQTKLLG